MTAAVSAGRVRTLLEDARTGRPLTDRFDMLWWWLPDLKGFAGGIDLLHARRNSKGKTVALADLTCLVGPLRVDQVHREP